MASEQLLMQSRIIVNKEIERLRAELDKAEYASTALATALLNEAPLLVGVHVYPSDFSIEENYFLWEVNSLDEVWQRLLVDEQHKDISWEDIEVAYAPGDIGDKEFHFEQNDISAAYRRVKGGK